MSVYLSFAEFIGVFTVSSSNEVTVSYNISTQPDMNANWSTSGEQSSI
jgi:hypothetical protein